MRTDEEFIDNDEEGDGDDDSGPLSPLLLELRDPDARPPDWNLARDPVPDMVGSVRSGGSICQWMSRCYVGCTLQKLSQIQDSAIAPSICAMMEQAYGAALPGIALSQAICVKKQSPSASNHGLPAQADALLYARLKPN